MHIDHLAIWTNDLEKEKNFFQRYFDCSVSGKYTNPTTLFSSYFIIFHTGARIELMKGQVVISPVEDKIKGLAHFAIDLGSREKVDNLTEQMEKDGFIIAGRPRITGDGYYESVILDPEGNRIELISTLIF